MRARTSASQASGSMSLSLAVAISVVTAAALGSAFGAGEQPRLTSEGKTAQRPLGGVVAKTNPAVLEKAIKAVPALEQIVDRFDDRGRSRQAGTFFAQPSLQLGKERSALLLPDARAPVGAGPVDCALDVEQRVDALHCLQRDRRDGRRRLAAPCIGGDIGQLEELAAGVCPTQRRPDRALRSRWIIQPVRAGIGVARCPSHAGRDALVCDPARRNRAQPVAQCRRTGDRRAHRPKCGR